jgi:hypothetical protein
VLTDTAALRRRVGPVAWCALEVLVARSRPGADCLIADASVRLVAAELAVAKNTAQRALKTLRAAEVVTPTQIRSAAGQFGSASYVLSLPAEMLTPAGRAHQPKQQSSRRLASPDRAAPVIEQLVLVPSGLGVPVFDQPGPRARPSQIRQVPACGLGWFPGRCCG